MFKGLKMKTLREWAAEHQVEVCYDAQRHEVLLGGRRYRVGRIPGVVFIQDCGRHYVVDEEALAEAVLAG